MINKASQKKIVFIVPEKVHLLDISGPAHVFYEAKKAGVHLELLFVSIDNSTNNKSSAGLLFSKLIPISDLEVSSDDFIFVPGSENILYITKTNNNFLTYLKEWHKRGVNICSICVGAFWLAEAGILNGKKSTTHWRYLDKLQKLYPKTKVQKENLFVISDNLTMSAGVSSGIDLSLHILEKLFGYNLTLKISNEIVYYFRRAGDDPQLSPFLKYRNHIDSSVHKIQDYIMNNLNKRFRLDDIAEQVNMSKRNMSRKFKQKTQITIGEYINILKVERAEHLLSKGYTHTSIALELNYKNTNQLKTLLKKYNSIS